MSDLFVTAASLEGVPSALAGSRSGIDAVLQDRGLRRSGPEHTVQSLLLGAAATATLEGDPVDSEDLADGAGGPTARAAFRLSSELLGLMHRWEAAPLQAIARLHSIAAAGSVPDPDLGRPSNPAGAVRLTVLSKLLTHPTTAPALAVAAMVHAEILTAKAFGSHDGVVARAAERLVLISRGVDPVSAIVPEAGHAASPAAYSSAAIAYATGTRAGLRTWMFYAAEAFTRGAAASPLAAFPRR